MKNMGVAPCTAMSFTQWFTRSAPTVWCRFISKAIFSLVPTPSTLETRIGSTYFFLSMAKRPPKPPISLSTPRLKVLWARYLMRCLVRSEEHTSELQSLRHLVCRLLLEKKIQLTSHARTLPADPHLSTSLHPPYSA